MAVLCVCRARSDDESRWSDKKYAGATTAEVRLPDNNALAVAVCALFSFFFVCLFSAVPRRPLLCAEHEKEDMSPEQPSGVRKVSCCCSSCSSSSLEAGILPACEL